MASLFSFAPATVRVYATTSAKGAGGSKEKGPFDWIIGSLIKEDQFYETDPILNKVEDKNGGTTSNGRNKNSVQVPQNKKNGGLGGFGGLFAKK